MTGYCRTVALVCALLSGCNTYVNIPAQPGDMAMHNPNDRAVRIVLVEALNAVLEKHPIDGKLAVLLPDNTSAKTYRAVTARTSKHAVWPGNKERNDLPILEVRQVLIRREQAWVDVVCTRPSRDDATDGHEQVSTVELEWHTFKGWLIKSIRDWSVPVEDAFWAREDEFE